MAMMIAPAIVKIELVKSSAAVTPFGSPPTSMSVTAFKQIPYFTVNEPTPPNLANRSFPVTTQIQLKLRQAPSEWD
jgi:hypothetical protein